VDQVCSSVLTGGSGGSSSTATAYMLVIGSASFTSIGSSATVMLSTGSVWPSTAPSRNRPAASATALGRGRLSRLDKLSGQEAGAVVAGGCSLSTEYCNTASGLSANHVALLNRPLLPGSRTAFATRTRQAPRRQPLAAGGSQPSPVATFHRRSIAVFRLDLRQLLEEHRLTLKGGDIQKLERGQKTELLGFTPLLPETTLLLRALLLPWTSTPTLLAMAWLDRFRPIALPTTSTPKALLPMRTPSWLLPAMMFRAAVKDPPMRLLLLPLPCTSTPSHLQSAWRAGRHRTRREKALDVL
jgi:hypothetical protein